MPSRESRPVPSHVHGSSKYYYDLGCRHPPCIKVASEAKAANRARRKAERVWITDHWEHPALKPFDSDSPRRHGTKYARTTFGCECSHCKSRPGTVTFPGTSLLWAGNVDERVAGSVLAVAVAVAIYRLLPAIVVQVAPLVRAIHPPRVLLIRSVVVALTAFTASPLVLSVVLALVVAGARSFLHPERKPA